MEAVEYSVWISLMEFTGIFKSLGKWTSISMTSKNKLGEIHISQGPDWNLLLCPIISLVRSDYVSIAIKHQYYKDHK